MSGRGANQVQLLIAGTSGLILEIGCVPPSALQVERARRYELFELHLAALRALPLGGRIELLDELGSLTAGFTFIFVDRHGSTPTILPLDEDVLVEQKKLMVVLRNSWRISSVWLHAPITIHGEHIVGHDR